ncbi:putative MFS family arabinose efflux permease [Fontibacillus solani]|uniref:Putative MFS family arabinose efflux permease n=1 Tax=Fontibacillus solani TaxID=1572857 RepID=A0A7W3SXY4_9BACL|nr:MFS transporter [Fontibacillus solani]MBA9088195.1 putative MFS family arabinose efflux permease [Fontibacillus solani]
MAPLEKLVEGTKTIAMSRPMILLFAISCGLSVANIYYAQPLLDAIASEFAIPHSLVGLVVTITQICYAFGLLLLVPLGDLLNRRWLISGQMLLSVAALITIGLAPSSTIVFIGIAGVGLLAVVAQTLVAFAATLATSAERGRVVGLVTSGIVIGILLARSLAGVLTDFTGWRSVYLFSAGLTFLMAGALFRVLPSEKRQRESLSYLRLLRSILTLFLEEPVLRVRASLAFLIFTDFSILWTSLVLPLSAPPFSLSHTAVGAFGLAGVAGALAATRAGRLADRGMGQKTTGAALILLLASWCPISLIQHSILALIVGIVLLDLAVQAVHVTNQSMILSVRPEARSRLTGGYMMFYSFGSALGSIASTAIYEQAGWRGVCMLGAGVSTLALLFWWMTRRYQPSSKSN